ncbi:MAG: glycogen/starch/alpha-glucan phosphorylase [Leptospiraceae bacterium]|nr:glycogen/starch/alpha-glucan phosphorylase [Leptospiraceae bacterium]MCK6382317.1 glycogen/starch/alpha-glucan phosphorylase [Leptospiraceae bacterium]NUM41030.1 glycogen/starch/alpha-glucan phosphorylase [Leptospiraceae bacterium]
MDKNHEKLWNLLDREQNTDASSLEKSFAHHLEYTVGRHKNNTEKQDIYKALSYTVRDIMIDRLNETQLKYREENPKRVYYLSLEFLIGRTLCNSLINLGLYDVMQKVMHDFGYDLTEILEFEPDAGLGNGGLGRLAACFLDSMATLNLPGYGYGIRYEYGIFNQHIQNGYQIEKPDHWLGNLNPWEMVRPEVQFPVHYYGHVETRVDATGEMVSVWIPGETVLAVAHDYPVPGYNTNTVNDLRLWSARSSEEFNLDYFNHGDYLKAVEDKQKTENISKVLYPNDTTQQGKMLRLKQQYFMVASSLLDIIKRYKRKNTNFDNFSKEVAIQLNDTHPSIAIPELMRILVDIEKIYWDTAWEIVQNVFAYTNHTVLPEALEVWSANLLGELLPRHLEIIYVINHRFLEDIRKLGKFSETEISQLSIIQEGPEQKIRMSNLAIIGSHKVNGVAELHSELLKTLVFPAFYKLSPDKFNNKTNGITQRRWLIQSNPLLSELIHSKIGGNFATDLYALKELEKYSEDNNFKKAWREVKLENKKRLAQIILADTGIEVDIHSMFDVQVKRFHEYKRQLLNVLGVIGEFIKIKENPRAEVVPRTIIFGGKAAPGYYMAKLIIKFITSIAEVINNDPDVNGRIKVVFLPNYRVSLAEKIFPASDLSEQISTAGTEASGTGNMKFALNGALTIGTLDGANIEIMEEVGEENIYIFGLKTSEVLEIKKKGYNPQDYVKSNHEIKKIFTLIRENFFSKNQVDLFKPLHDNLYYTDTYLLLADYQMYFDCQRKIDEDFKKEDIWVKKSIMNVARMGKFSTDRTIQEYAKDIWNIHPVQVKKPNTLFSFKNTKQGK